MKQVGKKKYIQYLPKVSRFLIAANGKKHFSFTKIQIFILQFLQYFFILNFGLAILKLSFIWYIFRNRWKCFRVAKRVISIWGYLGSLVRDGKSGNEGALRLKNWTSLTYPTNIFPPHSNRINGYKCLGLDIKIISNGTATDPSLNKLWLHVEELNLSPTRLLDWNPVDNNEDDYLDAYTSGNKISNNSKPIQTYISIMK